MKIHWRVEGMSCGGCSKRLTELLGALAGVSELQVSHEQASVSLTLDESQTSQETIRETIEDAGFDVMA